jgi:mRNA-degrading endonuclease RelE of RelBE toxin-antitoxin system
VAEFVTGPLLDNPLRVGHPLRDEYDGQYSARRSRDWRVRYRLDQDTQTVIVLDVSQIRHLRHLMNLLNIQTGVVRRRGRCGRER